MIIPKALEETELVDLDADGPDSNAEAFQKSKIDIIGAILI